jgi:hypothetical protein
MKQLLLLFYIVACHSLFSQTIQLTAKIVGDNLNEGEGRILVVKAVDSSVVKGSYLETFNVDLRFDASKDTNFLFVVDVPEFKKQYIPFSVLDTKKIDLGEIRLIADLTLEEVKVSYKKPMFERTMDGMTINVKFLFSILFLLFTYCASANTTVELSTEKSSIEATVEFADKGKKRQKAARKKARKGQKMNKKRKRACGKWGARSYAG